MNIPRPSSLPQIHFDSWDRLSAYVSQSGRTLNAELGWGNEGIVYSTTIKTAIKAYRHAHLYEKERDVYFRLFERDVLSVGRFTVPQMLHHSPELKCIEMTIVSPPFILDFAGAYLDAKPPFNEEEWEAWEIEKIEQFEDQWPEVRSALAVFRRHGIYLNDVKPGNVTFPD